MTETRKTQLHNMTDRDWGKMVATCPTHGPDTPMSSKGHCLKAKRERRKQRGDGYNSGKGGRSYKMADGSSLTIPFRVIREWFERSPNCEVCGKAFDEMTETFHPPRTLDHCHTTGEIRGVLCRTCNIMLGMAKDDPTILAAAIKYLEDHRVG